MSREPIVPSSFLPGSLDTSNDLQARIQKIIAQRFLPLLDDVLVAHRTHILRTTAYTGGPSCIAGVLGSKAVDLGASGKLLRLPSALLLLALSSMFTKYLSEFLKSTCLSEPFWGVRSSCSAF